jgi:hypothetical protein
VALAAVSAALALTIDGYGEIVSRVKSGRAEIGDTWATAGQARNGRRLVAHSLLILQPALVAVLALVRRVGPSVRLREPAWLDGAWIARRRTAYASVVVGVEVLLVGLISSWAERG